MKIIITIVIVFVLLTPLPVFAENYFTEDLFIFVQTIIRNSDGVLVAYIESTKFTEVNVFDLNSFLEFEVSQGNDPIVTVDGNNYQIIRRVQSQTFDSPELVASTILINNVPEGKVTLARFAHDGYNVYSGDTMDSIWTFIRPVS